MAKLLCYVTIASILITLCSSSAIPMWEFLSRGEKMSHLYSMFAKQVSSYCKTNIDSPVAQCKRDLLVFGVDKLEKMTDSHLDAMDPYQRGANDIIWDSMMEGHRLRPSKKHDSTPSPIREPTGHYEKNPLFNDDNDNDYRQNQAASSQQASYASGMDDMYSTYNYPTAAEGPYRQQQHNSLLTAQGEATNIDLNYDFPSETVATTTNFLSGPMIIRVRPDGTPVEEDKLKPLPRDDDREAMTIGKNGLPTAQQISANFNPAYPQQRQLPLGRRTVFASYRTIRI